MSRYVHDAMTINSRIIEVEFVVNGRQHQLSSRLPSETQVKNKNKEESPTHLFVYPTISKLFTGSLMACGASTSYAMISLFVQFSALADFINPPPPTHSV